MRLAAAFAGLLVAAPLTLALVAVRLVSPETGPTFSLMALAMLAGTIVLLPLLWRRSRRWRPVVSAGFVGRQVLLGLAFGVACVIGMVGLTLALDPPRNVALELMGWEFLVGFWIYLAVAGMVFSGRVQLRQASLERAAADARMAALVSKLQPHFLFNTLTSIVELIDESPAAAERAVEDLSVILRRALALGPGEDVTLGDELSLVERYFALERLRLGDRLTTEIRATEPARACSVPVFAVQALAENAVRHGLAPLPAGGTVAIDAEVSEGRLRIRVSDTGAGCGPATLERGDGVGLATLRHVLDARHGPAATLDIETAPGEGLKATLVLPTADE